MNTVTKRQSIAAVAVVLSLIGVAFASGLAGARQAAPVVVVGDPSCADVAPGAT